MNVRPNLKFVLWDVLETDFAWDYAHPKKADVQGPDK